jgi:hypothetical protein
VTELRIISDDQMAQIKARRWMRCLFSIEEGHVGDRRNVRITWFGRMIGPIVEHLGYLEPVLWSRMPRFMIWWKRRRMRPHDTT